MSTTDETRIKEEIDAISENIDAILKKIDSAMPVEPEASQQDRKPSSDSQTKRAPGED
jgi:hypothetical protein